MNDPITNINTLNDKQKVNYVKNTLFNNEINDAIDVLIKDEKKDLKVAKIILDVLEEKLIIDRIKQQCNLSDDKNAKLFVCSKILSVLNFYNKTVILNNFLKLFTNDQLKDIAIYEYQNKTNVSLNNKVFNKYCLKYKKEAYDSLMIAEEEKIKISDAQKDYNSLSKNRKKLSIILVVVVFLVSIFSVLGYKLNEYYKLVKEYDGTVLNGIYLNDLDLSGIKIDDLKNIIDQEENKLLQDEIIIKNINQEYKTTFSQIGTQTNKTNLVNDIKNYNNNLSFFKKVKFIKTDSKNKVFYIKFNISDEKLNELISSLKNEFNTNAIDDGLVIDENHNVSYSKGKNGFTLDEEKTKIILENKLSRLKPNMVIEVSGNVVKNDTKYVILSSVNSKVSSYTTYFVNAGNRGYNINLAAKRLNGTIVMPGEVFSYLKVAGPYGASNGYLPAPVYLNSEVKTESGGGVCQLASTLYNATLRAGLQTISRKGHTFAPNYVPKGLDATVYSTTTDFKFKNNHEYPVYIVSYSKGNYLTVDIWSNENALGGLTYEPYSIASNGGYLAYLKTIKDGKVIETKYLDRSVYKVHP